jgi:hypothetical protein
VLRGQRCKTAVPAVFLGMRCVRREKGKWEKRKRRGITKARKDENAKNDKYITKPDFLE